jgi:Flp pilus assembly protein TadD
MNRKERRIEQSQHSSAFPTTDAAQFQLLPKALALHEAGNLNDAETIYRTMLASNPKNEHALVLLGTIYAQRGNAEEALRLMDSAIAINPNNAAAYYNRGRAFHAMGRYNDALESYDRAIILKSDYVDPYYNKGLIKLLLGEYEQGWKLYEWRWKHVAQFKPRVLPNPLWLGEKPIAGKTIFLHAEQALGDTIQFCRYLPMLEAMGPKVIFEVHPSLLGLLSTLKGSFHLLAQGNPLPEFDFQCPLMSLPLAFKTSLNTIPASIPYLRADSEKRNTWKERLGEKVNPRIGLVWSGATYHKNDHNRSIALSLFAPLLHSQCDFHSIQKEYRPNDPAVLAANRVTSHAKALNDFTDTAALISEMDLIISVDTSVVHLAGALGKPVWILLPFVPDFRWLTGRKDSPWYPTARLFRQTTIGNWTNVLETMKDELDVFVETCSLAGPN